MVTLSKLSCQSGTSLPKSCSPLRTQGFPKGSLWALVDPGVSLIPMEKSLSTPR